MAASEKVKLPSGTPPIAVSEVTMESLIIDPVEEKKVLRKIDRVVMPLMFVVFFFQCRYSICPMTAVCLHYSLTS